MSTQIHSKVITPTFLPLVEACKAYGISRSVAFKLVKNKLLDSFTIGMRRYVYVESLDSLPERLASKGGMK